MKPRLTFRGVLVFIYISTPQSLSLLKILVQCYGSKVIRINFWNWKRLPVLNIFSRMTVYNETIRTTDSEKGRTLLMEKFGWAYIGCGSIAHRTATELVQTEDNKIVAVWNRYGQRQKILLKNTGGLFTIRRKRRSMPQMWKACM